MQSRLKYRRKNPEIKKTANEYRHILSTDVEFFSLDFFRHDF